MKSSDIPEFSHCSLCGGFKSVQYSHPIFWAILPAGIFGAGAAPSVILKQSLPQLKLSKLCKEPKWNGCLHPNLEVYAEDGFYQNGSSFCMQRMPTGMACLPVRRTFLNADYPETMYAPDLIFIIGPPRFETTYPVGEAVSRLRLLRPPSVAIGTRHRRHAGMDAAFPTAKLQVPNNRTMYRNDPDSTSRRGQAQ